MQVIERLTAVEIQLRSPPALVTPVVRYTGFEKQHRIIGFAIMGFFKKALEISGAKNVVLCFTVPIEEGKVFRALDFLELTEARRDSMFASFFVSRVDSKMDFPAESSTATLGIRLSWVNPW